MRWLLFDALVSGGAPMPEQGLAWALYYQVAKNQAAGRKAVEWAADHKNTDPRQLALIFDWCGTLMSKPQADRVAAKLEKSLAAAAFGRRRQQNGRALAAIALADRLPDQGDAVLKGIVQQWWRAGVAKNPRAIPREQIYLLYEMMHALRDNLKIDLRESSHAYFKTLPTDHLVGHYPSPVRGAGKRVSRPDLCSRRRAEPDRRRFFAGRGVGDGRLRQQRRRQPVSARLADAGPLPDAREPGRAFTNFCGPILISRG